MKSGNLIKILFLSTVSAGLLSGCANMGNPFTKMNWPDWSKFGESKPQKTSCPEVGIMPDIGSITQLRDNQVVSETVIGSITPSCQSAPDKSTIRLSIGFKGHLGPAGVKDAKVEANYSVPYLVAVLNPKGEIISKDIFAISLIYKAGQTEQTYNDLLEQVIPLKTGEDPTAYKILVGFQLDDEQLDYNRKMASKK